MTPEKLNRGQWIYLAVVDVLGLSLAFVSLASAGLTFTTPFLILAIITAVMAPHSVRIGMRMEMSVFHPFILTAMLLMGLNASLVIAAVAVLSLGFSHRPRWEAYRTLFNVSAFMITTWITCPRPRSSSPRSATTCPRGGPSSGTTIRRSGASIPRPASTPR